MPLLTALNAIARIPAEKFDTESLPAILGPSSFAGCHEGAGYIVEPPLSLKIPSNYHLYCPIVPPRCQITPRTSPIPVYGPLYHCGRRSFVMRVIRVRLRNRSNENCSRASLVHRLDLKIGPWLVLYECKPVDASGRHLEMPVDGLCG